MEDQANRSHGGERGGGTKSDLEGVRNRSVSFS
jgi:hypothetical protein